MTSAVAHSKTKQDGALRTLFSWSHDRIFTGFVFDGANLSRHFVVELVVDGRPLRSVHATDYVNMLAGDNIGDGCYGFCFSLDASTLSDADCVEARIANLVHKDIAVEDWGMATFTCANGIVATLEASWTINAPFAANI